MHEHRRGRGKNAYVFYSYDVQWLDGEIEKGVSESRYSTFEEYKQSFDRAIENTSKQLNRQYQKRAEADKLEAKAREAFGLIGG